MCSNRRFSENYYEITAFFRSLMPFKPGVCIMRYAYIYLDMLLGAAVGQQLEIEGIMRT